MQRSYVRWRIEKYRVCRKQKCVGSNEPTQSLIDQIIFMLELVRCFWGERIATRIQRETSAGDHRQRCPSTGRKSYAVETHGDMIALARDH